MTGDTENSLDGKPIAKAEVRPRHGFSIIWVVPLVALAIGGWLAFTTLRDKGPTITITFLSAEGLEAGKTSIKHKDVSIGRVKSIRLSDDLSKVVVTAELVKGSEKFLNDNTRFWVVRARVSGGTVSGLNTVLYGAYIGADPRLDGKPTTSFTGLEVPPVVTTGQPGSHFWLRAEKLGSVDLGAPVYYRQIQVGQVVSYNFSADGQGVDIRVFIEAPYHNNVKSNTRFWNASGVDVSLGASGLSMRTESLVAIVAGGIAFENPHELTKGEPAQPDSRFRLYPDHGSTLEKVYGERTHWLLIFDESVRGLEIGAPVEMYGIKVGEVVSRELEYNRQSGALRVPVVVAIEPERIQGFSEFVDPHQGNRQEAFVRMMVGQQGLDAKLRTVNLLTGQLLVELNVHPGQRNRVISQYKGYSVLPTTRGNLVQAQENLSSILAKLDKVPFEKISSELLVTLHDAGVTFRQTGATVERINRETIPQLEKTLTAMEAALIELQGTMGKDSALNYQARKALEELNLTLRALRNLSTTLEQQPQSLLFGKGGSTDE